MASFNARSGAIYFEHRGARANARVLFIHGLGCQLVQWPDSLIAGLVATGLCAVTFDNRDAGLSNGPEGPPPSLEALMATGADALTPDYTLSDMAQDAVDLLDHLGQAGAHVVGVSMGGMIGQRLAIEHPNRVYSLTSIMSSTGNPALPEPSEDAMAAAMALTDDNVETAVAHGIRAARVFAGRHFDSRQNGMARFTERAVARAFRPHGVVRQYAAIVADGDRRAALAKLTVPTLVIHGAADPLVPVAAGKDTAASVPDAHYIELDQLGHDLSEPVIPAIVDAIAAHVHAVEVSR